MKKIILLTNIILIIIGQIFADDYHVRVGGSAYGTGNGSDWDNAFSGFTQIDWGEIGDGDTLFISGGDYPDKLAVESSGTGDPYSERVIIKRATSSDSGWDNG